MSWDLLLGVVGGVILAQETHDLPRLTTEVRHLVRTLLRSRLDAAHFRLREGTRA